VTVGLGVVGCGSVFWTPYMSLIERLQTQGRVRVTAVLDADPEKRAAAAARLT
jgi:predicted dehydrogenase